MTPGHGALAKLDAPFALFCGGLALDPAMEAAVMAHAGHVKAALEPWAAEAAYLNFAERKVDTSKSFGAFTYRRLQAVKERLDPGNVIHANHAV